MADTNLLKIVILDTDFEALEELSQNLSTHFRCYLVSSPKEAFQRITSGEMDALIMELGLDSVNPFHFIRKVREREESLHLPIIILSEHSSLDDKVKCFELGVDEYIVKPFLLDEVIVRLRSRIRPYQKIKDLQNKLKSNEANKSLETIDITEVYEE